MILKDATIRLGCADFAPDFKLHPTRDQLATWDEVVAALGAP
jgi:hypothetical protein